MSLFYRTYHSLCVIGTVILFCSCGIKKTTVNPPSSLTLEQRISAGEFVWLDNMELSEIDNSKMERCSGVYVLTHSYDSLGKLQSAAQSFADSLVLTPNGYYRMYKKESLLEYGRYSIRKKSCKICIDFSTDSLKSQPQERGQQEYEIRGRTDMVIDMYNHRHEHKSFWIRCFKDGRAPTIHEKQYQHLVFLQNLDNPECFQFYTPKNSSYWIME